MKTIELNEQQKELLISLLQSVIEEDNSAYSKAVSRSIINKLEEDNG